MTKARREKKKPAAAPTSITGGNGEPLFVRKKLRPATKNHLDYFRSIRKNHITLCYGPAGCGKTYQACGMAAGMLLKKQISRIVLTRPAVECGEKLGALPGELEDKLGPYLMPLYDALGDFLSLKELRQYQEDGIIEICPLAYMRGRTLRDAFVILDEAENCQYSQLKMFLTRYGHGAKMVVNGDVTQSDLPDRTRTKNPFERVVENLQNVDDIGIVRMTEADIMRPEIVKEIVKRL
jgi:phosphate starvation-inducible PhoH-like protein